MVFMTLYHGGLPVGSNALEQNGDRLMSWKDLGSNPICATSGGCDLQPVI